MLFNTDMFHQSGELCLCKLFFIIKSLFLFVKLINGPSLTVNFFLTRHYASNAYRMRATITCYTLVYLAQHNAYFLFVITVITRTKRKCGKGRSSDISLNCTTQQFIIR